MTGRSRAYCRNLAARQQRLRPLRTGTTRRCDDQGVRGISSRSGAASDRRTGARACPAGKGTAFNAAIAALNAAAGNERGKRVVIGRPGCRCGTCHSIAAGPAQDSGGTRMLRLSQRPAPGQKPPRLQRACAGAAARDASRVYAHCETVRPPSFSGRPTRSHTVR